MENELKKSLSAINTNFKGKIIKYYLLLKERSLKSEYSKEFDSAGIAIGKFCETILRFLQFEMFGTFTPFGRSIPNFADECRRIITATGVHPDSLKKIMPRALVFIYSIRNNRDIGHIGEGLEANRIDNNIMLQTSDWIICELIRIYNKLPLEEAQSIIDNVLQKKLSIIWEIDGTKKVMDNSLSYKQKILVLLYGNLSNKGTVEDLFSWTGYSNYSGFKKILKELDSENELYYNETKSEVHLSPLGIQEVESLMKNRI